MVSTDVKTAGGAIAAFVPDRPDALLHAHLGQLILEKEALEAELLRCHEQVNLVFDITEHIAGLRDATAVEETLLRRYGTMLRAGAAFVDQAGCCVGMELGETKARRCTLAPQRVRAALAAQIEMVRQAHRTVAATLSGAQAAALRGAHALLGPLRRKDTETAVVVVLRDADERPFDASDVLASETVLVYGAQVLRNASMVRRLHRTALETVYALVNAIGAKDNYTSDHSERVGGLARLAGAALGLPNERLLTLEWAGLLHDVGKIGIREQILNKPGELTAAEFAEVRNHPRIGHDVLRPVAQLEPLLSTVLYHHENHDGSGYPNGLRGDEVPLDARIIHVVDVFDALTTNRPYRRGYDVEHAVGLLERDAGRVTDPEVTRLFIDSLRRHRNDAPDSIRTRFVSLAETTVESAGGQPAGAVSASSGGPPSHRVQV